MAVVINGRDLTVEEVIRVCRQDEKVEIAPDAQKAVQKARDYIEKKLEEGAVIYGLTTGFGKFSNVLISREETADLQKNLIMSPHLHHGASLIRVSMSERLCCCAAMPCPEEIPVFVCPPYRHLSICSTPRYPSCNSKKGLPGRLR